MSKENINLPKTAFSMKANLQNKEPEILDYWNKIDLYKELRKSNKGKEKLSESLRELAVPNANSLGLNSPIVSPLTSVKVIFPKEK